MLSEDPRQRGILDGLPSVFPDPHPEATRSLGDDYVRWVESVVGTPLRWWQWLTAQRRYEIRADGSWCWLQAFTSVPRQQGKSVELARDAAWHGSLGRGGLILHAAHRVTTSRDVQAELWRWAAEQGLGVARQLGDSRITWADGSVWQTVAMESAYSRRPLRLLVDEVWAMDPTQFWNAMWPALGGQDEPVQALFWSAANPKDLGLVADLRSDPDVCRMEWGALPGEDRSDPAVWRRASAYWNRGREKLMAKAHGRPGFAENWLNIWPPPADAARWLPRSATDRAASVRVAKLPPASATCAVECSLDGQRWAVAAAWSDRRGTKTRVWAVDSLAACLRISGDHRIKAHQAVLELAPRSQRWRIDAVSTAQHRAATGALRDAVRSAHIAIAGLDDQDWAKVRTTPADGGEIIDGRRSAGDVQGVKAAAWAVWAVESQQEQSGFVF